MSDNDTTTGHAGRYGGGEASAEADRPRNRRKVREGLVVSDKMDKTVVVVVEDRVKHPLYGKVLRRTSKLKAHDETQRVRASATGSPSWRPGRCPPRSVGGSWRSSKRPSDQDARPAGRAWFRQAPQTRLARSTRAARELADIGDRRDSAGVATARRRQHRCQGDPVHPGARWLRSALREHRRRHRGHGQGRHSRAPV